MIGPGEFLYDEKDGHITAVVIEGELQPHTPAEHDMFAAIVKHYSGTFSASVALSMDGGNLSAKFVIPMPELEAVQKDGRAGIELKADMDAKRAADAKAKADKKAADEEREKELAAVAAKAQGVTDSNLIKAAALAGATAAKTVIEESKK